MVRVLTSGLSPRVVRKLRDGGHEVVVVDAGVSAEQLAAAAVQEDVVAIALWNGDSDIEAGAVPAALTAYEAGDIVVLGVD
jgi:methylmalonyl-CoA mutase cobalamin-binding subunit